MLQTANGHYPIINTDKMSTYNYKSVILYTLAGLMVGIMLIVNAYLLNVEHGFNEPWFHIFDYSADFKIIVALPIAFSLLFCFIGMRWQQLVAFNKQIKTNLTHEQELGSMADRHLRMLGKVVADMNESVIIVDNTGCILWVNEGFCGITGYTFKEAIGNNAGFIFSGLPGETTLMDRVKLNLAKKENGIEEIESIQKDGSRYWSMINAKPVFNEKNKISNYVIIQTDITTRKERELSLEETHKKMGAWGVSSDENIHRQPGAKEMLKTGSWEMDTNGKLFVSKELRKIFGLSLTGEIKMELIYNRIHPEDTGTVKKMIASASKNEKVEFEFRYMYSGTMLYLMSNIYPIRDKKSLLTGYRGRIIDVTQSRMMELALVKSEAEKSAVFNNAQTLICLHDVEGVIFDINDAAIKQCGYKKEELLGQNLNLVIPEQYLHEFDQYLVNLKENKTANGVFYLVSKTGKKMSWLYQSTLCKNEQGRHYVISTSIDITESLKAQIKIEQQQEFINQIIENSPNVIFVVNEQQQVVLHNKTFEQYYLCNEEQPLTIADLVKQKDDIFLGGFDKHFEMEDGQTVNFDGSISGNAFNGYAVCWFTVIKKCFTDKKGKKYILVIGMDITSRYQVEKDLVAANEIVERSLKIKDQFISNMSHEIRTPLNAVIGFTGLLEDTPLTSEQEEYIDIIKSASENLLSLVNNVLDLSKLESGEIELEKVPVDTRKVIMDVARILEPRTDEKGIELKINIDDNVPERITGDPLRLSQILFNLLGNAIKFTDKGYIEISCRTVSGPDSIKNYLSFTVKDTGIGVPVEKQEAIFGRFSQANNNTQRLYGGTGLGLNITKGIVDMHGGTLKMESTPGEGTAFYFILPFDKCKEDAVKERMLPVTKKEGRPVLPPGIILEVLLVEDNLINALLAKQVLEKEGFTITHVVNGLEAVNAVQEKQFDVVLMDIQMPVMNGLDATTAIRALNTTVAEIPIVAMTANSLYGEMQNCYNAGMTGYVSKPFKPENLFAAILNSINIKSSKKADRCISDMITYNL